MKGGASLPFLMPLFKGKVMKHAFTLVELMVVIVILGLLAAIAVPRYLGMASKARLAEFKPFLKSIYMLQETHRAEAGSYAGDASAIGFAAPSGKASFSYGIADGTGAQGVLGRATVHASGLRLVDGTSIAVGQDVACVDGNGLQYASTTGLGGYLASSLAQDAALLDPTGVVQVSACQ